MSDHRWNREHETRMSSNEELVETANVMFTRSGKMAADYNSSNAHKIELHRNYNGNHETNQRGITALSQYRHTD